MSEGTAERTRESDADAESAASADSTVTDVTDVSPAIGTDTASDTADETGGSYFSLRALVVAFVAVGAGMTLGNLVPVLPFTAFAGIPIGTFLHGLLDSERRYAETAIAGGLLSGLAVVTALLPQLVAGTSGMRLFAVGAGVGTVLAVLGHYFGRDLRDGLTRDL